MKKLNKVAMLFASAALAIPMAALAQTPEQFRAANATDQWRTSADTIPWKNGTNELCWRDANWSPATAHPNCDGAAKPPPPPPPPAPCPHDADGTAKMIAPTSARIAPRVKVLISCLLPAGPPPIERSSASP